MTSRRTLTDEEFDVVREELEKIAHRPEHLKANGEPNQAKVARFLQVSQQLSNKYFLSNQIGPEVATAVAKKTGHKHLVDLVRARRPAPAKDGDHDPALDAAIVWCRDANFPEPVILRARSFSTVPLGSAAS